MKLLLFILLQKLLDKQNEKIRIIKIITKIKIIRIRVQNNYIYRGNNTCFRIGQDP